MRARWLNFFGALLTLLGVGLSVNAANGGSSSWVYGIFAFILIAAGLNFLCYVWTVGCFLQGQPERIIGGILIIFVSIGLFSVGIAQTIIIGCALLYIGIGHIICGIKDIDIDIDW
ncbi:MAG: hypothetical protein FWH05_01330 [Oscillospiraceae bacterium]|nr:hypothetical protein [Oscillospiraceae bacterium]